MKPAHKFTDIWLNFFDVNFCSKLTCKLTSAFRAIPWRWVDREYSLGEITWIAFQGNPQSAVFGEPHQDCSLTPCISFVCFTFFSLRPNRQAHRTLRGSAVCHSPQSFYQSACLRRNAGISTSSMPLEDIASTRAEAEPRGLRHTLGTAIEP